MQRATFPSEPLARYRFFALWFALLTALANAAMIALNAAASLPSRVAGIAAIATLTLWWAWVYHRGYYTRAGLVPEAVLLLLAGGASAAPQQGFGLFLGAYQLQSLHVSRRQLPWMLIVFGLARLGAAVVGTDLGVRAMWSIPAIGSVIMFTYLGFTLHALAEGMIRQTAGEAALRRSEERYRLLAAAMRDVIYDWTIESGVIEWTENMKSVFGYSREDIRNDIAWWMERVHPDDRSRVNEVLKPSTVPTGKTVQYRFRRANGDYATVSATGVVQRDPFGTPVRVIGAVRDITAG